MKRTFVEPIGAAETIARYVGKLVVALCAELEERGLGALCFDLVCHLVDNRIQAVRVGTAQPLRDVKRLTRLMCDKIETIDPGFGIEVLRLAATSVQPFATVQAMSWLIDAAPADVTGLIDILANRLGSSSLYRMAPAQSDVPERSFVRVEAMAPNSDVVWPIWYSAAGVNGRREGAISSMPRPRRAIWHGWLHGALTIGSNYPSVDRYLRPKAATRCRYGGSYALIRRSRRCAA